jgi:hypothetical protein
MNRGSLLGLAAGGAAITLVGVVGVLSLVRSGRQPPAVLPSPSSSAPGSHPMSGPGLGVGPGSKALRAQGCSEAIVSDMLRLLGEGGTIRDDEPRYIASCDVTSPMVALPTCDKLAEVFFAAVGGNLDGRINIRVSSAGSRNFACSKMYAPNGADLGPFPRNP